MSWHVLAGMQRYAGTPAPCETSHRAELQHEPNLPRQKQPLSGSIGRSAAELLGIEISGNSRRARGAAACGWWSSSAP
jgi:hypothetical protein